MCGIAGVIDGERSRDDLLGGAHAMASMLRHRGPDDVALWADRDEPVAFGFTRLAILDLSERGRQPMVSADRRHVMVFNGELYNHRALRGRLQGEGVVFRSTSDTEVMLEAIACWGLEVALQRSNGMFALAVYDRRDRVCSLARDRLGEKPLYYGSCGDAKVFASELKALRALPDFDAALDPHAIRRYFAHGYVPGPHTVHGGLRMLPAGSSVDMSTDGFGTPRPYWRLTEVASVEVSRRSEATARSSVARTRCALLDSVERRLVADVPVGVFLSGGTDSALVAALARRATNGPIDAFTIGFEEASADESSNAALVAKALGLRHHVIPLDPSGVLDVIPRIAEVFDEPFSDPAAVAMFVMAREVSDAVTVVLSGDGADEMFGGYPEYRYLQLAETLRRNAPDLVSPVLRAAGRLTTRWSQNSVSPKTAIRGRLFAGWMQTDSPAAFFKDLDVWSVASRALREFEEPDDENVAAWQEDVIPVVERAMLHDQLTRLPDRMLTKVDRASMAWSVEVRTPFLDPEVVAASWSLPTRLKVGGSATSKSVLREILADELGGMRTGAKHGFSLPLGPWLRSELRDWAEDLLRHELPQHEELLNAPFIREVWRAHAEGRIDDRRLLWTVLMFLAWARGQRVQRRACLVPATIVPAQ